MKIFKIIKYILVGLIVLVISVFFYLKFTDQNINEVALKVFTVVKAASGKQVDLNKIETSESKEIDHNDWSDLLKANVGISGNVDYPGFLNEKDKLESYLKKLSENPPKPLTSQNYKMAYWINAYNAFTVKLIIDNYPLRSIKDISDGLPLINSPWDIKFFQIGSLSFDLNTIEHEILRKQFDEPRIHFAINCASRSCPKLRNEAYTEAHLEEQLENQAIEFINDPTRNKITASHTKLSKIFNWFAAEFKKEVSIEKYLKKYAPEMNEENKITFLEYDWHLNEQSSVVSGKEMNQ